MLGRLKDLQQAQMANVKQKGHR